MTAGANGHAALDGGHLSSLVAIGGRSTCGSSPRGRSDPPVDAESHCPARQYARDSRPMAEPALIRQSALEYEAARGDGTRRAAGPLSSRRSQTLPSLRPPRSGRSAATSGTTPPRSLSPAPSPLWRVQDTEPGQQGIRITDRVQPSRRMVSPRTGRGNPPFSMRRLRARCRRNRPPNCHGDDACAAAPRTAPGRGRS